MNKNPWRTKRKKKKTKPNVGLWTVRNCFNIMPPIGQFVSLMKVFPKFFSKKIIPTKKRNPHGTKHQRDKGIIKILTNIIKVI